MVMNAGEKVQTYSLKVLVTTDDYEIRGLMHTRPGGYQSRISDLLNLKDLHYVPITQATYRSLKNPDEPPRKAWTMIIRLDTIKLVIPEENVESQSGEEQGQEENSQGQHLPIAAQAVFREPRSGTLPMPPMPPMKATG